MKEKTFVNDETEREGNLPFVLRFTHAPDFFVIVFLNVFVRMMLKARESKHYYKIIGRPS